MCVTIDDIDADTLVVPSVGQKLGGWIRDLLGQSESNTYNHVLKRVGQRHFKTFCNIILCRVKVTSVRTRQ